jgi:hypothetical protein
VTFARIVIQVTYLLSVVYMASQLTFNIKRLIAYMEQPKYELHSEILYGLVHILPILCTVVVWY